MRYFGNAPPYAPVTAEISYRAQLPTRDLTNHRHSRGRIYGSGLSSRATGLPIIFTLETPSSVFQRSHDVTKSICGKYIVVDSFLWSPARRWTRITVVCAAAGGYRRSVRFETLSTKTSGEWTLFPLQGENIFASRVQPRGNCALAVANDFTRSHDWHARGSSTTGRHNPNPGRTAGLKPYQIGPRPHAPENMQVKLSKICGDSCSDDFLDCEPRVTERGSPSVHECVRPRNRTDSCALGIHSDCLPVRPALGQHRTRLPYCTIPLGRVTRSAEWRKASGTLEILEPAVIDDSGTK